MNFFLILLVLWANIAASQEIETAKPYLECHAKDGSLHMIAELKGFKNFKVVNYKLRFDSEPLYVNKKIHNSSFITNLITSSNNMTSRQFVFEANNVRHFIYLFHKGRIRRERLKLKSSDLKTAEGTFSFREGKGRNKQDFRFDLSCEFKSYD